MASDGDSRPAEDVETLTLQLELEKLERQWLEEKQPYLGYEDINVPLSYFLGFFMFAAPIVIMCVGLLRFLDEKKPGLEFVAVGAFVLIGSVVVWQYHGRKERLYKAAKQRYEERREELLQALAASRQTGEGNRR